MHDEYVGDTMTSFRNEKRKTTIKRKSEFGNILFVLGFISPLQYETSAKSWLETGYTHFISACYKYTANCNNVIFKSTCLKVVK